MEHVLSILIYCLVRVHIEHSTKVKVKGVGKKARLSKNKLGHSGACGCQATGISHCFPLA